MATEKVQATISVKSENFHQTFEESIFDSSTTNQLSSYEELIAANERLKVNISKIFTEFVNKARLEQEANGDKKKRKIKHDDDEKDDDDEEGEEEDGDAAESSDNNEDEQ
ncbi:unnamed protein product [Rotaria sp. Silwood2]|nr:unnamed protein product [Rotaria sp. Silwood2]CAF2687197.1 unnamed protein product [Rotaria sp. Silwood2]CAF3081106.1 unnamed protein product [Rotaria sp. Silwood2]CAF3926834.1 unnamed protein product [Rotaria sp. Silwood2]CAF3971019.1 unnamed protein product [Rotaria sp. Silwood2]